MSQQIPNLNIKVIVLMKYYFLSLPYDILFIMDYGPVMLLAFHYVIRQVSAINAWLCHYAIRQMQAACKLSLDLSRRLHN